MKNINGKMFLANLKIMNSNENFVSCEIKKGENMNITAISVENLEEKGLDLLPNKMELKVRGNIFPLCSISDNQWSCCQYVQSFRGLGRICDQIWRRSG